MEVQVQESPGLGRAQKLTSKKSTAKLRSPISKSSDLELGLSPIQPKSPQWNQDLIETLEQGEVATLREVAEVVL